MSIEDDLRGHFTDQEWVLVQERENDGGSASVIAARYGLPETQVTEVLCRWRGLVAGWEQANWPPS